MTPLAAYLLLFTAVGAGFILVHLLLGKLIRPNTPDAEKGTIYECGEPTIGSAWIQFDLRFYVVALLFVIFDVEVAFFFPWAEVFGKANAVATAPAPKTAAEYNEYARLVLDLGPPAAATSGDSKLRFERLRYESLQRLTPADLEAKNQLTKAEVATLKKVNTADLVALQALTDEERAVVTKLTAKELKNIDTETENKDVLRLPVEVKDALRKVAPEDLALLFATEPAVRAVLDDLPVRENSSRASELALLAFAEVVVFFGVLLVGFAYLWRRGDLAWVRSVSDRHKAAAPSGGVGETNGAPGALGRPLAGAGASERS